MYSAISGTAYKSITPLCLILNNCDMSRFSKLARELQVVLPSRPLYPRNSTTVETSNHRLSLNIIKLIMRFLIREAVQL